jgi:hypothetical protein
MTTRPNPNPRRCMGVEIDCTWPSGAWWPGAQPPSVDARYEAFIGDSWPQNRLAADTLVEMRRLIREALVAD